MSTPPAKLQVFVANSLACIKIAGRANFASSIDFKSLITVLTEEGYHCFAIDLSECCLMDSTFMGVLAGFGLKMAPNGSSNGGPIELINPNARVLELIESLGVLHLFRVVNGEFKTTVQLAQRAQDLDGRVHTHEEVTRNCLEAHKVLMDVSADNIPRFKDVAKFLEEDLKRNHPAS